MLRAEDMTDSFWSISERERVEEVNLRREIATVDAQLDVIRRRELVQHAPGFTDFLKSLQALHVVTREKLVGDGKLTDQGLREVRGSVKGIESVLALLTSSTEGKQLAERRAELQNALQEALKRRPKPKEVTP